MTLIKPEDVPGLVVGTVEDAIATAISNNNPTTLLFKGKANVASTLTNIGNCCNNTVLTTILLFIIFVREMLL